MTREDAIKIIQNEYKCVDRDCDIDRNCGKCDLMMLTKEPILKVYEMAIKALSQEPCDDAVSREAVINAICDYVALEEYEDKSHTFTIRPLEKRIKQLPSVTQKSGKWIDREVYDADRWKCSECGRTEPYKENYCPNCGAKMESEEISERNMKMWEEIFKAERGDKE